MQRDDVALGEKPVDRHMDEPVGCLEIRPARAIVIQDPHPETRGATGNRLPDPAQPDQAKCSAVDILAQQRLGAPRFPFALPNVRLALDHAPRRGEHQRHGKIGACLGEHVGRIGNKHATRGGRRQVDVVIADGVVADDAKPGGGVKQRRVDPVRQQRKQAIALAGLPQQFLTWRRKLAGPDLHPGMLGQQIKCRLGQVTCYINAWQAHACSFLDFPTAAGGALRPDMRIFDARAGVEEHHGFLGLDPAVS